MVPHRNKNGCEWTMRDWGSYKRVGILSYKYDVSDFAEDSEELFFSEFTPVNFLLIYHIVSKEMNCIDTCSSNKGAKIVDYLDTVLLLLNASFF